MDVVACGMRWWTLARHTPCTMTSWAAFGSVAPGVEDLKAKREVKRESNREDKVDGEGKNDKGHRETKVKEVGGPKGHEPTRYGDWERAGRCSDF